MAVLYVPLLWPVVCCPDANEEVAAALLLGCAADAADFMGGSAAVVGDSGSMAWAFSCMKPGLRIQQQLQWSGAGAVAAPG